MSSSLIFNVRTGLNRYGELLRSDPGLSFNPIELGFPESLVNQLPVKAFPRLNFYTTSTTTEYQALGRTNRSNEITTVFSLQPNFSWTKSRHDLRGGLDMRLTWYTREIARLYQSRPFSSDTQIEAGFGVYLGLAALRDLDPSLRVTRALVVGPGLDLAPRTNLVDVVPPQSYQPFAVADALEALSYAHCDSP